MGAYYRPVFTSASGCIVAALRPNHYGMDVKIMPQELAGNPLLRAVEMMLSRDGGGRLTWACDYDEIDSDGENLYTRVEDRHCVQISPVDEWAHYAPVRYVVNADRGQYFDNFALPRTARGGEPLSPLPRLTKVGGPWCGDRIYATATEPDLFPVRMSEVFNRPYVCV